MIKKIFFLLLLLFISVESFSQSTLCDSLTPTFNVNLSNNPNGTFVSNPAVRRLGNCCSTTSPDRCVQFIISLHPGAAAIRFDIASGAVPPGAMFYQVGCGPQTQVGNAICLTGPGPHILTFCKPGNNLNTYAITSIPAPFTSSPDTVVQGCFTPIQINGVVVDSSIVWTSIFPGAVGTYDNLLNCTIGCKSVNFVPDTNTPSFVDYLVCGTPEAPCLATAQFCDTVRIHVLPQLEVSSPSPITYCSLSGGVQLNGTVTGGSPPYNMSWTDAGGTQIGNASSTYVTAPGTYYFSATDNSYSSCPIVKTATVQVIQKLPATVSAGTNFSVCPDNPTVNLNGTIINGTTVQWIGGAGTFSPSRNVLNPTYTMTAAEILAGSVTLTISSTGDTICPPDASTVDLIITAPLVTGITAPTNICFGALANLSVNISGGTPPYNIVWSSGETTQSISSKLPGTYIVTITDNSASPCAVSDTFLILEDPPISVSIPNSIITCDTVVTLNTIITGGRPNFTYQWNTFQTTDSIQAYTGNYSVTVTDSLGCKASDSCIVTASNSLLAATVSPPPAVCIGDSTFIKINVTGNTGSYSAIWSTGQNSDSISVPSGSYCVTVTDSIGCITTACGDLINDTIKFDITPINVNCFGSNNGAGHTTITSGISPYDYQWSGNGNNDTTASSSSLGAGNYLITVIDAIGCQLTKPLTITEPTQVMANLSKTDATCFASCNGSAQATASGGIPPYTYFWPLTSTSGPNISNLCAQAYSVIVTDSNGCSNVNSVTIIEPTDIGASFNIVPSNCGKPDGSISVNASGATPGYFYSWSPGGQSTPVITSLSTGTYCVSITDSKGCQKSFCTPLTNIPGVSSSVSNATAISCIGRCDGAASTVSSGGQPPYNYLWSNSYGTQNIQNLCTGIYTLLTIDANGCQDTTNAYVGYPPPVIATAVVPNLVCDTGNIAVAYGSGGNGGPFTFYWTPDSVYTDSLLVLPAYSPYTVKAFDVNGCESDTIVVFAEPYLPIISTVLIQPSDSICLGDSVLFSATSTGGKPGYQYTWMPSGMTGPNVTVYPNATGHQYVIIEDQCATEKRDSVFITVLPIPFLNPQSDIYYGCAPLCVNLSNSNSIYPTCKWDFDDGSTLDSCFASHCYTEGGQYYPTLTVSDQFGCTNTDSTTFFIDVIGQPTANFTTSILEKDIYIHKDVIFTDVSVYSGTNQWYFMLNGDTLFNFTNILNPELNFDLSGEYTVQLIIVNANGCTDTVSKIIIVKDLDFIYVPNTFTPNGNGDNESFYPSIVGFFDYSTYKLEIFNRWGQLIFVSNNYGEAWNGTFKGVMSKEDTYVWKLEIRMLYEDRREQFIGHVNLLK